ncbi:MAG: bifunctional 4-hydroxy-2-oxoglutarate aldolase/2-dehydro-3-deoxy-phosphogluconate aldolase [Pseudohongiellaceae bacterium]
MTSHDTLKPILKKAPVVPVVVIDNPNDAVPVAKALVAGGIPTIEVTMRTSAAAESIAAIVEQVPEAVVGAGTVLSPKQAEAIVKAGAKFIVSPGFHEDVVATAEKLSVPVIPGIATATEAQQAWNHGLRLLKFFPAEQAGGVATIKALAAVFRDVLFVPTGGISTSNLEEYLSLPAVLACGGSWLTPAKLIADDDFGGITKLAREALALANKVRG